MSTPIEVVIKRTASNGAVMRRISRKIEQKNPTTPFFRSLNTFRLNFDKAQLKPFVPSVAGFIAAFTEISILFPSEYCKTQLQLNRNDPTFSIKTHLKERGFRIYQALPPMLIGAPLQGLLRFSCLEGVQNSSILKSINSPTLSGLIAGMTAGVVESVVIVTPMETVKTKLIDGNKGLIEGIRHIVKLQGFAGLYNGLVPTIAKSASNQAIRFVVFAQYKDFMLKRGQKSQLRPIEAMSGGILAGLIGCLLNTPVDTIKSRMQGLDKGRYKNSLDCLVQMVRHEGVLSLYKGLVMRSARVVPGQGIIFLVYDQASRRLNKSLSS